MVSVTRPLFSGLHADRGGRGAWWPPSCYVVPGRCPTGVGEAVSVFPSLSVAVTGDALGCVYTVSVLWALSYNLSVYGNPLSKRPTAIDRSRPAEFVRGGPRPRCDAFWVEPLGPSLVTESGTFVNGVSVLTRRDMRTGSRPPRAANQQAPWTWAARPPELGEAAGGAPRPQLTETPGAAGVGVGSAQVACSREPLAAEAAAHGGPAPACSGTAVFEGRLPRSGPWGCGCDVVGHGARTSGAALNRLRSKL